MHDVLNDERQEGSAWIRPCQYRTLYVLTEWLRLCETLLSFFGNSRSMILRPGCRNSVRCLQARWVIPQCRKPIRYYSSSEKPPFELPKAYLEKLQAELKPRLEPVVLRFQNASRTLKKMSRDVGDTKEALKCASAAINELTGYTHIEQVKRKVTEQGMCKRERKKGARELYSSRER